MSDLKIIHNGDHAEFELEHADVPLHERPDWPLPSFDARDWAAAFVKQFPIFDEGTALAWFAGALMRGYDEANARHTRAAAIADMSAAPTPPASDGWIKWEGGPCPVAEGTRVDMWLSDGRVLRGVEWEHEVPDLTHIVAYGISASSDGSPCAVSQRIEGANG